MNSRWSEPSSLAYLLYEGTYFAAMTGLTLGFSLRLEGRRNMPPTGPALVIANHQSFLDPPLVGLAVRRHLTYLARKTLFRNALFARFIRSHNAVPIDQEGIGKEGLRTVLQQLQAGKAVQVFPEGERTPDGKMQALRPGIHLLIKRTEVPIVPVGIAGAYEAWPRQRRYPVLAPLFLPAGPGTIAVSVGRPLDSRRFAGMSREASLTGLFVELQKVCERAERLRRK